MYESSFALSKNPFTLAPDPSLLFATSSYREALAGITYAILKRRGFVVVTGDAGTGKTTLLNAITDRMSGRAVFGRIVNPTLTASEFLELVLLEFGIRCASSSKAQRIVELREFLARADEEGRAAVLMIDEAQALTRNLLEEIRLLTNLETSSTKLLQVVLSGQSELLNVIDRHDLRQLKQRIAVRVHIAPLSPLEVAEYIAHRWTTAGGKRVPFSADALRAVAEGSRGIPRLVNSICENVLMLAYGAVADRVELHHVLEVLGDLGIAGTALRAAPTLDTAETVVSQIERQREAGADVVGQSARPAALKQFGGILSLNLTEHSR